MAQIIKPLFKYLYYLSYFVKGLSIYDFIVVLAIFIFIVLIFEHGLKLELLDLDFKLVTVFVFIVFILEALILALVSINFLSKYVVIE